MEVGYIRDGAEWKCETTKGKAFQAEVFFQKLFGKRRGVQKGVQNARSGQKVRFGLILAPGHQFYVF